MQILEELEIDDDSIIAILSNLSTDSQRTIVINHILKGQETTSEEITILSLCVDNGNAEFEHLMGYINTAVDKQQKGVMGNVK